VIRRMLCDRRLVVLVALVATMLAACGEKPETPEKPGVVRYAGVPAVQDTMLVFTSGDTVVPGLRQMHYLGRFDVPGGSSFFVVGGVECADCDASPTVLIRSPTAGKAVIRSELAGWYPYPGRIYDYPDTTVVLSDSRLFWGQCIASTLRGVVRYSTEYLDGRPVRTLVRETVVMRDSLIDLDPVDNPTFIEVTRERVFAGRCHEVPPRHRPRDP
jgi:hypothetical protein